MPGFVKRRLRPVGAEELIPPVDGEVPDTLLRQHAHVDLKAQEGEDWEGEDGEDDDVAEVLYRLDDRSNDRLQACGGEIILDISYERKTMS